MQLDIGFTHDAAALRPEQLRPVRSEWVARPPDAVTLASLRAMNASTFAIHEDAVVGFVGGFTDGVLITYVWDAEVVPAWRGRGLEDALLRRHLDRYGRLYQVNAHPSAAWAPHFLAAGFTPYAADEARAMTIQRMELQAGP